MKKILYTLLFFHLVACTDFLNREPLDALSNESFWKTEKDALAGLNACYKKWELGEKIIYMDCASDNAYNPFPWEGYTVLGNGNATATDPGTSYWEFEVIRKCNNLLENIDQIPMDQHLKNRYKAEARFIRAYRFFVTNRNYGDMPKITKVLNSSEANQASRAPSSEIVKFILDELTEIAPLLPNKYPSNETGRITKGAVWALKARIELYEKMYEQCIITCDSISKLGYSLFDNYTDLFRPQYENNSEVILDIQYIPNIQPFTSLGVMPTKTAGGWCSINPNQSLADAYECSNGKLISDPTSGFDPENPFDNRDPRLDATLIRPGLRYNNIYYDPITKNGAEYYAPYGTSKTGYLVKKFSANLADFDDMWKVGLNIIVIRYAEILLSYAEAKIELNQIDTKMYDAINLIRTRAGLPKVDQNIYNNQSKLRELVRRERRVELAMEGLRWYDVQRWKIAKTVMSGTLHGSRLGTIDEKTGKISFHPSEVIFVEERSFDESKNYLWPIPQKELDANPNLKPNNPGY